MARRFIPSDKNSWRELPSLWSSSRQNWSQLEWDDRLDLLQPHGNFIMQNVARRRRTREQSDVKSLRRHIHALLHEER